MSDSAVQAEMPTEQQCASPTGTSDDQFMRSAIDLKAILCVLLVASNGAAIAVLPHLVRFQMTGDSAYVADPDDLIYVANGTRAFSGEAIGNRDLPTGHPPGMLPFVGTVPFLHLAHLFGERPLSVLIVWRVWAGLSMSIGLFLLMRSYFSSLLPALLTALLLPCDAGWLMCRPGIQNFVMARRFWMDPDAVITRGTDVHWQLRVISPATLMVWLLLYFWLLGRARETARALWIVLSGISLGLLCDAYFFFATTAALGLCFLLILDSGHRMTYVKVALISGLVALPIVFNIWSARAMMSAEAVNRLGIAADLADGLTLPRVAVIALVVGGGWTIWKRREIIPLWCFALSGLLLYNSHLLTGIDFQHGHWRAYALMPISSLILLIVGFDILATLRPQWLIRTVLSVAAVASVAAGYYLRLEAAVRPKASLRSDRVVQAWDIARQLEPWSVVAGPEEFITPSAVSQAVIPLYDAIVFHSSFISENELARRRALNEIMIGATADDYAQKIIHDLDTYPFGDAAEDLNVRERTQELYIEEFETTLHDISSRIHEFDVRYLVLPVGEKPSEVVTPYFAHVSTGDNWTLFEIKRDLREQPVRSDTGN